MLGIQNNPFHKANPFRVVQYERFEHPHLQGQAQDHQHLIYQEGRPMSNKVIENNWTFNENNLTRKIGFTRKQDLTSSRVSDFEIKLKMSSIGIPSKNAQKLAYAKEGRLENPFFRKNLLINKEEVLNQVELDVSLYRTKAKSSYEPTSITVSSLPAPTYEESPVVSKPRVSFNEHDNRVRNSINFVDSQYIPNESPNVSLGYSKTPELTQRASDRVIRQESSNSEEEQRPNTIQFKGRTFFIN
jgi:hypothetical protein